MYKNLDKGFFYAIITLLILGLIMVKSATYHKDFDVLLLKQYFSKQLIFITFSSIIAWIIISENHLTKNINIDFFYNNSWWIYIFTIIGLILVFMPIIGHSVNGSTRWIRIAGFTLQPSELAKLSIIITMARFIVRQNKNIPELIGLIKTLILTIPFLFLLLLETDFGASAIITATAFAVMFIAGTRIGYLVLIILSLALIYALIVSLDFNKVGRLEDFLGGSYQGTQALIAITRGDWFGIGLGASLQKLSKLSEVHTDMIFSLIAEELGIFIIIIIIALYSYIFYKGFNIAINTIKQGKKFASYLAFGISFYLSLQTIYNILMNIGLLPIKGFTLPLISYGGSSILITIISLAILLRIDIENKQKS